MHGDGDRPRAVGPYVIEGELGRGGMGTVYRARAADGSGVALKVVRSSLTTRDALRRFEREARIRIDHPNVVRVLDAGVDAEGAPYIALELLEGSSLAERLADRPLAAPDVLAIALQTCRGLEAAHGAGVVHRDLKPSNIFCCADGTVKLLDFGVSSLRDADTRLTQSGHVLGTLCYLAPEQAEGQTGFDPRTDVWALGAVLYEALAGRPPFREDTALATVVATMLADVPPLRALCPDVPPALEAVIVRALRKKPAERWASARELRIALERAEESPLAWAPASVATIPPEEQRVVALLYAKGVTDGARIESAVRREHGLVVPLVGGDLLGLFGAESTIGDEVSRAVAIAIGCRAAALRIAVSSGRATSTAHAIAGSALDAAETSVALAVGGVAISGEAARGLPRGAGLTPIGNDVYELPATERALEAITAPIADGEIVGREIELLQIHRAMASVLEERSLASVWITGPAGIGKSRLRAEAERMIARSEPAFVRMFARSEPRHARQDLSLFRVLLRGHAEQLGATLEDAPRALASAALSSTSEIERCAEMFRLLLPAAADRDERLVDGQPTDLQAIDDRIQLALLEWMLALARRGPLALVLEDVQWASGSSLALLERIRAHAFDLPLLIVGTARPELAEARSELFVDGSTTRLELRGLGLEHVRVIAERVLGRAADREWVEKLAKRTDGNPFFIEQIVRGLQEGPLGDGTERLPWTVEAALQARLDHLAPLEKELCRKASVLGRAFTPAELAALGVASPRPVIAALRKRGILSARGEDRYDFSGDLLAEASYRMIADDARVSLHARAAEVLASVPGADPEEIAQHHESGGAPAAAADAYLRALSVAAARGDAQTMLRTSDAALRLGIASDRLFDVRIARADALRFVGRRDAQSVELGEALAHVRTDAQRARVLSEQCVAASRSGSSSEAVALGHAAIAAARASGDPSALVLALGRSLLALLQLGRPSEAAPLLDEAVLLAGPLDVRTRALVSEWQGQFAGATGDLDARRRAFARAAELHRGAGDLRRAAGAESNLADADNRVGAYASAERALSEACDACRKVGHAVMEGYALVNLAYARTRMGEPARALGPLDAASEIAERLGEVRLSCAIRVYRARALAALGRAGEAAELAEGAADEAVQRGMPSVAITALTIAAEARLALGESERALSLSSRAMARMDEIGGVEEDEIEVHLAHARAAEVTGRHELAETTRQRARGRLAELAASIADPALRERFLCDVAAHRALTSAGE